nr:MAG TPA: PBP-dependent ABC transporter [Caudoviricetes sp.]
MCVHAHACLRDFVIYPPIYTIYTFYIIKPLLLE